MSKNYDMIANVSIDVSAPITDDESFGNLCIVGPLPRVAPTTAPPLVGVYSSIDEVSDAGWEVSGASADPVGVAAMVAFSQSPKPTKIYIAPIQVVEGEDEESAPESITKTATRAVETGGWYVMCTAGVSLSDCSAVAAYIESQEKMYVYSENGFFGANGNNAPSVTGEYYRTVGVYCNEDPADPHYSTDIEANMFINVAFAAKWMNYEPGSETTAFKALSAVNPSVLSATQMNALDDNNMNYFIKIGNKSITMNGKVLAGEWADVIRFRDWQKNDMQVRVANLFITTPKIPYTDGGISLVQNQMIASLKAGQTAGGIAEEEFDEDGNTIPGFKTSVPRSASLSASEKASRKLRKCKFKARLAGAIHFAELNGSLTYEL